MYCPGVFYLKIAFFPKSRAEENTRKTPLLRNGSVERRIMRTGLKKRDKTTEIYFDEATRTQNRATRRLRYAKAASLSV